MTQQTINVGTADKGNGDPLRTAFIKVNANFNELYAALGADFENLETHIIPSEDDTYDLGSPTKKWRSLYVGGNTIYLDNIPLTVEGGILKVNGSSFNLGSFEFTNNVMTTTDSSNIIIDQNLVIRSELTMQGDIVPNVANEHNLGSPTHPWGSLYVSNNTIYIGGNALKIDSNGDLTLNNNRIVQENGEYLVLDNLTDVSANSPSVGDVLTWNGGSWVNAAQDTGDITFDGITIQGVGDVYGGGGIQLSPDPSMVETGQYFRIRGGDNPTHLHLDTGDNIAYDQYFGDDGKYLKLAKEGPIIIGTGGHIWTFDDSGASLTIPGDIRSEGAINIDINLTDSTLRRWTFSEDGILTLPSSAEAATLEENSGLLAKGRNVTLTATGLGFNGVVNIKSNSGANTWTFGNTGNLTIPGSIYLPGNIGIEEDNGSLLTAAPNHIILSAGTDGTGAVSIKTNQENNEWSFAANGNLTIPGVILGTGPQGVTIGANYSAYIVTDYGDNDRTWTFDGSSGDTILPNGTIIGDDGNNNTQIRVPAAIPGTWKEWTFSANGVLTVPGAIQLSNGAQIFNTAGLDNSITIGATDTNGNTTFNGSGFFNGDVVFRKAIQEKFSSLQDATGVVTHDCANGHIFYHTSSDANWTVNLTNFSLLTNYATTVTIIISQGGTGYYPNALQIGGTAQTINWQGNATPTPSTNRVDVVTFSVFLTGSGYTVLGQLTGF